MSHPLDTRPRGSTLLLVVILLGVLAVIGVAAVSLGSQERTNASAKGKRDAVAACANAARMALWAELARYGSAYLTSSNPVGEIVLPDGTTLAAPAHYASAGVRRAPGREDRPHPPGRPLRGGEDRGPHEPHGGRAEPARRHRVHRRGPLQGREGARGRDRVHDGARAVAGEAMTDLAHPRRLLGLAAALALALRPAAGAAQTCEPNDAARDLLAASYLDTALNPSDGEDMDFLKRESGAPNIMVLFDSSGSMRRLPPDGPGRIGGTLPPGHLLVESVESRAADRRQDVAEPRRRVRPRSRLRELARAVPGTALASVRQRAFHPPCGKSVTEGLVNATYAGATTHYAAEMNVCPYFSSSSNQTYVGAGEAAGYDPNFYNNAGATDVAKNGKPGLLRPRPDLPRHRRDRGDRRERQHLLRDLRLGQRRSTSSTTSATAGATGRSTRTRRTTTPTARSRTSARRRGRPRRGRRRRRPTSRSATPA